MTDINKQKFLAELGKLLTFMYEEDRQTALAMYSRMFELAEDEQALLSFLASPTRQAVVVARAYNSKERKLQVSAQSREDELPLEPSQETPDFVLAIDEIQRSAQAQMNFAPEPQAAVDQLSLFELEALPQSPENEAEVLPDPEPEDQPQAEENSQPADEAKHPEQLQIMPEGEQENSPEDAVDSFLADFAIVDEEQADEPALDSPEPVEQEEGIVLMPEEEIQPEDSVRENGSVRKPKIFLLILFTIIAVPVTLLAVILLLVPTFLCLVLAVCAIVLGAAALIAAFGGFAVFADILVVLGASLAALALGLLFLWLFLWFIGGVIAGLIKAVIGLGAKWCYKEVPVE